MTHINYLYRFFKQLKKMKLIFFTVMIKTGSLTIFFQYICLVIYYEPLIIIYNNNDNDD